MLLKRIAEDVAGSSYGAMIRERIARPLGLLRTFVPESVSDLSTLAPAASRALASDGATREVRDHYHPGWVSHGVVASTPSDIARFFDALFCGGLLSAQSLHEMTTLVPIGRGGGRVGVTLAPAGLRPWDHGRSGIVVGSTMGSQRRRAGLHDQRVSRARPRSLGVRDVCARGRRHRGTDRLRGARHAPSSTVKTAAYSSRGSVRAKRPLRRSSSVCSISARVFITKGP